MFQKKKSHVYVLLEHRTHKTKPRVLLSLFFFFFFYWTAISTRLHLLTFNKSRKMWCKALCSAPWWTTVSLIKAQKQHPLLSTFCQRPPDAVGEWTSPRHSIYACALPYLPFSCVCLCMRGCRLRFALIHTSCVRACRSSLVRSCVDASVTVPAPASRVGPIAVYSLTAWPQERHTTESAWRVCKNSQPMADGQPASQATRRQLLVVRPERYCVTASSALKHQQGVTQQHIGGASSAVVV